MLVGGCPSSLCAGGGFGGRGGFGPSLVPASSWYATVGVGVIWSFGYGFGLPSVSTPSRMIYFQDPGADGGSGGGESRENRSVFGFPTLTPRPFLVVSWQRVSAWVGVGEEQSPADEPISQRLDEFQTSLDVAGLAPVYGNAADIANAIISIFRGNYVDAALSAGAVIPVIGQGITSAKIATRTTRKVLDVFRKAR